MGCFCVRHITEEEREFKKLKKSFTYKLEDLRNVVKNCNLQKGLFEPFVETIEIYKTILGLFKNYLGEETIKQTIKQYYRDPDVNILRLENQKLSSANAQLKNELSKLHKKSELEIESVCKNEAESYERTIKAKNALIEELSLSLNEHQNKQINQGEELLKLRSEVENERQKTCEVQKQLKQTAEECHDLRIQLKSFNRSELWVTPCQSLNELTSRYKPLQNTERKSMRMSLDSITEYDPYSNRAKHLTSGFERMEIDDEDFPSEINNEEYENRLEIMHGEIAKKDILLKELQEELINRTGGSNYSSKVATENLASLLYTPTLENAEVRQLQECCKTLLEFSRLAEEREKTLLEKYTQLDNDKAFLINQSELEKRLKTLQEENNALAVNQQTFQEQKEVIEHFKKRIIGYQDEIAHLQKLNNSLQSETTTSSVYHTRSNEDDAVQHQQDALKLVDTVNNDIFDIAKQVNDFQGNPNDRQYLHLKEMLIRNMINLDNIESRGDETIRFQRSKAMKATQVLMDLLESKGLG